MKTTPMKRPAAVLLPIVSCIFFASTSIAQEDVHLNRTIETLADGKAVENIEEIAAVPGIGAIFIGPSDLSISYGVPGQRDHPELAAGMKKVLDVCKRRNIPCGLTTSTNSVAQYLEEGYSFVTVGYWNDAGISGDVAEALEIAREASGRNTE